MSMQMQKKRLISLLLAVVLLSSLFQLPAFADTARFGRVNYNQVRFRKTDSSAEGQEWWTMLNAGWVVEILGETANNYGRWYKVTCVIPEDTSHAYVGFIMRQYITEMNAEQIAAWLADPVQPGVTAYAQTTDTAQQTDTADTYLSGCINTDKVFFRKTPSTTSAYWALLPLGHTLTLLEASPVKNNGMSWYHVQGSLPTDPDGVYEGYIYSPFLTVSSAGTSTAAPATAAPTVQPTAAPTSAASSYVGVINLSKVYFRKTPGIDTSFWALLPAGFTLTLLDPDPVSYNGVKWYHVTGGIPTDPDGTYEGYVYHAYLTVTAAATEAPDVTVLPVVTAAPEATEAPSSSLLTGYVNTDKVFFRKSPDFNAAYWAILPVGHVLSLIDPEPLVNASGKWYHVSGGTPANMNGSYEGYIFASFFTPVVPEVTAAPTAAPTQDTSGTVYATVVVSGANLKVSPDASSATITALVSGQILEVLDSADSAMVHVRVGTYEGYISAASIRVIAEYTAAPTQTAAPVVTPAPTAVPTLIPTASPTTLPTSDVYQKCIGYIKITKPDVNLRKSPNGASVTLDGVSRIKLYSILPFYREPVKGGDYYWIYVYYNGSFGYVRSDCYEILTSTPTPDPNQTAAPTPLPQNQVNGYIILNKEGVNLRRTPGGETLTPTDEDKLHIYTVLPYYSEPVSYGGYDWLYVYYNGYFGYVRSDCYSYYTPATTTPTPTKDNPAGYIRLVEGYVNFRKTPGGEVIGQLPIGTVLPYLRIDQDSVYQNWYYVYCERYVSYGYIKDTVAAVTSAPTASPTPSAVVTPVPDVAAVTATPLPDTSVNYLYTTNVLVYIRSGPGFNYNPIGQVQFINTVLIQRGAPTNDVSGVPWYPVLYDGLSGYIHSGYVSAVSDWQKQIYEATGVLPTPSPVPAFTVSPTEAPVSTNHLYITTDLVNVRIAPSMTANLVNGNLQVNQGEVYAYDLIAGDQQRNAFSWYHIAVSASVSGYVRSDFVHVMTNDEYQEYLANLSATPTPSPTAAVLPAYVRLSLYSSGDEVILVQNSLAAVGLLSSSGITGNFDLDTQAAVVQFQVRNGLTVNGIVDQETWNLLFSLSGISGVSDTSDNTSVTDSEGTPGANNAGSSVTVTLNPVEKADWYTSDIQTVFAAGVVAIVTDVYTGISYRVKRWAGGLHADVEPLTAADTAAICKIYKVNSADEISTRQSELETWRRRPLWVTIGNRTFAASAYGVPHNDDEQTILDNNYPGQFCIHFVNSRTHGSQVVDTANANNDYFGHQEAIEYAYTHSISGTK